MSIEEDPLWKRIWKTLGIRWLGPRGDGHADAMERFQHGFELGHAEAAAQRDRSMKILLDLWGVVSSIRHDRKMEVDGNQFTLQTEEWTDWANEIVDQTRDMILDLIHEIEGGAK